MNEQDFLKELEDLSDDNEPGFLKELTQQAPKELHINVMNAIRNEIIENENKNVIELKPRTRINYRRYVSYATAVALLVLAVIGGANNLLNKNVTPDTLGPKATVRVKSISPVTTIQKPTTKKQQQAVVETKNKPSTNAHKVVPNENSVSAIGNKTALAKTYDTSVKAKVEPKSNVNPVIASGKRQEALKSSDKTEPSTQSNTEIKEPSSDIATTNTDLTNPPAVVPDKNSTKSDTAATNNESAVNKVTPGIDFTHKQKDTDSKSIVNNRLSVAKAADNNSNTNKSGSNDNSDIIISPSAKTAPSKKVTKGDLAAEIDDTINYNVTLTSKQTDVLQFISNNGITISESDYIYKFTLDKFNQLNQLIEKDGIKSELVSEVTDQFVLIKLFIK